MTTPLRPLAGLTHRPLTQDEAGAVFEVMAEQEVHDTGRAEIELADIVGDWQRPSFDVGASTVGVFDGDRLVAYGEVTDAERGDAAVRPAYRGRGIGTWIAEWMQTMARSRGARTIGMPVPVDSPSDRLLTALGYHVRWTSWVLKLPGDATVPERDLPAGYSIRAAAPSEYVAVHDVVEDAFLEWSDRDRESFADFEATSVLRPGFEPWHLRVVVDRDDTVVAVALMSLVDDEDGPAEVYISRLATRRDLRGRGLAQALMVDTFAVARERGAVTCGLSTDSRTGALALYEKVGMQVTATWLHRAVHLPDPS